MATAAQSIRDIVATQTSAAAVFQRFEIDLCEQANQSLSQACANLQLSVDQVLEKLADARAGEAGSAPIDHASMPTDKLIQHIVRVHHRRIRVELPRLAEMSNKLVAMRPASAPELVAAHRLVRELQADMIAHLEKEEQVLFPFIANLDQQLGVAGPEPGACFRTVTQPIRIMKNEHNSATGILTELNRITNNFEVPECACATQLSFYTGLRAFETDLKQHMHLEDHVLFPRAVELEKSANLRATEN